MYWGMAALLSVSLTTCQQGPEKLTYEEQMQAYTLFLQDFAQAINEGDQEALMGRFGILPFVRKLVTHASVPISPQDVDKLAKHFYQQRFADQFMLELVGSLIGEGAFCEAVWVGPDENRKPRGVIRITFDGQRLTYLYLYLYRDAETGSVNIKDMFSLVSGDSASEFGYWFVANSYVGFMENTPRARQERDAFFSGREMLQDLSRGNLFGLDAAMQKIAATHPHHKFLLLTQMDLAIKRADSVGFDSAARAFEQHHADNPALMLKQLAWAQKYRSPEAYLTALDDLKAIVGQDELLDLWKVVTLCEMGALDQAAAFLEQQQQPSINWHAYLYSQQMKMVIAYHKNRYAQMVRLYEQVLQHYALTTKEMPMAELLEPATYADFYASAAWQQYQQEQAATPPTAAEQP